MCQRIMCPCGEALRQCSPVVLFDPPLFGMQILVFLLACTVVCFACSTSLSMNPNFLVLFGSTCFCQAWDVVSMTSLDEIVVESVKCVRYRCPYKKIDITNTSYGFPGGSYVRVPGHERLIEDVNIGDSVYECRSMQCRYSSVIRFDHHVPFSFYSYLRIVVNDAKDQLIISPSHYLVSCQKTKFACAGDFVRADSVAVGDWIHRSVRPYWVVVKEIRIESHLGAFLPHTNGMLVVNGFDVFGGNGKPTGDWAFWI